MRRITGLLALLSGITAITLAIYVMVTGPTIKASMILTSLIVFGYAIAFSGYFALVCFCETTSVFLKHAVGLAGVSIATAAIPIIFNEELAVNNWNWLVAGGLLYILIVKLQLTKWGQGTKLLTKFLSLFMILSYGFLIVFFITTWPYSYLSTWVDVAIITAVFSFLLAFMFNQSRKTKLADKDG